MSAARATSVGAAPKAPPAGRRHRITWPDRPGHAAMAKPVAASTGIASPAGPTVHAAPATLVGLTEVVTRVSTGSRRSSVGSQRRDSWIRRSRSRGSWASVSTMADGGPPSSSAVTPPTTASVAPVSTISGHGRRSGGAGRARRAEQAVAAVHRTPARLTVGLATGLSRPPAEHGDPLGRMSPIEYVLQSGALTHEGYAMGYASPSVRLAPEEADAAGAVGAARHMPSFALSDVLNEDGSLNAPDLDEHRWASVLRDARRTAEDLACPQVDKDEKDLKDLYPNCHVHIWLRSCKHEVCTPLEGTVTGSIPRWLKGTLLRNGPGSLEVGQDKFQHLFDGAALLQRFCISDGGVTYQCRFLRSRTWRRNTEAQRIVVTEFGTRAAPDPCQTIFKRVAAMFRPGEVMSDNAMISVYPVGDAFYAFTESPVMTRVDPVTLHTLERVNVASLLGIVNHTSHPLVQEDGSVINLGMSLRHTGPQYSLIHFPAHKADDGGAPTSSVMAGRLEGGVAARWPLHPGYMHSFGATCAHFVLVEQPLSVSVPAMVRGQLSGEPLAASLRWFADQPTLIHLVSRVSGRRTHTFEADSFFFLHVINCFERPSLDDEDADRTAQAADGEVVVDICCYKDPAMISCMYIDALKEAQRNPDYARLFRGRPWRFVLPLADPDSRLRVQPRPLCDMGCETPRVNPNYFSKPYRFFYAISSDVDAQNPGTLIKVDTWTGSCYTWGEVGLYPSEPIFTLRPNPRAEDDGVLLCALVWADDAHRAGLLIVDATSMLELGRAEFATPGQVPKCLHGWYAPSVV